MFWVDAVGEAALRQRAQVREGVDKPRPKVLFEVGEMVRVKEVGAKAAVDAANAAVEWEEFTTLLYLIGGSGIGLLSSPSAMLRIRSISASW